MFETFGTTTILIVNCFCRIVFVYKIFLSKIHVGSKNVRRKVYGQKFILSPFSVENGLGPDVSCLQNFCTCKIICSKNFFVKIFYFQTFLGEKCSG